METGKWARLCAVLYRIFAVVFAVTFLWLTLLAVAYTTQGKSYLGLALLPVAAVAVYFLAKYGYPLYRRIPTKALDIAFVVLTVLALVLLMWTAPRLRTKFDVYSWDFYRLGNDSYHFAEGDLEKVNMEYYGRYPNNHMLLVLLIWLFRLVQAVAPAAGTELCHVVAIEVNAVLIIGSMALMYVAVRKMRSVHAAFAAFALMLLCSPLWLYAAIYYTDTASLFPMAVSVLVYAYARQADVLWKKTVLYALLGCLLAFGFLMKGSLVIFLVAFLLSDLLAIRGGGKALLKTLLPVACCLCLFAASVAVIKPALARYIGITAEMRDKYEYPYTHWIMMSLNKSGGYDKGDDVDFTRTFLTYEEKKTETVRVLKERLAQRGVSGTLYHLLVTKAQRTWGRGSMSADGYLSSVAQFYGRLYQLFVNGGKYHFVYFAYAQTYHTMLLALVVLSGITLFCRADGGGGRRCF